MQGNRTPLDPLLTIFLMGIVLFIGALFLTNISTYTQSQDAEKRRLAETNEQNIKKEVQSIESNVLTNIRITPLKYGLEEYNSRETILP
jgi:archaellum component FlaF (FlaF/FlaG flagellin family)